MWRLASVQAKRRFLLQARADKARWRRDMYFFRRRADLNARLAAAEGAEAAPIAAPNAPEVSAQNAGASEAITPEVAALEVAAPEDEAPVV